MSKLARGSSPTASRKASPSLFSGLQIPSHPFKFWQAIWQRSMGVSQPAHFFHGHCQQPNFPPPPGEVRKASSPRPLERYVASWSMGTPTMPRPPARASRRRLDREWDGAPTEPLWEWFLMGIQWLVRDLEIWCALKFFISNLHSCYVRVSIFWRTECHMTHSWGGRCNRDHPPELNGSNSSTISLPEGTVFIQVVGLVPVRLIVRWYHGPWWFTHGDPPPYGGQKKHDGTITHGGHMAHMGVAK